MLRKKKGLFFKLSLKSKKVLTLVNTWNIIEINMLPPKVANIHIEIKRTMY